MSFFDQAYDEMSWKEVCYRLPGDLAVSALQRRITNLDTLSSFFDIVQSQPSNVKQLKDHVNSIVTDFTVDEVFDKFETGRHPVLFNWMNDDNLKRLKDDGKDKLTHKFLYNLSNPDDVENLSKVLDDILAEEFPKQSEVLSVLNKISNKHFHGLLNIVLGDSRPDVRVCALSVTDVHNQSLVSDLHKTIALKALVKSSSVRYLSMLSFKAFSALRPKERLVALEKYFNTFPKYRQRKVFEPAPTEDEFQLVVFAGCIEQNELVKKLCSTYKEITELDPPVEASDEEEDA